ncbi:pyridoxamine 5'-phosphate oxidase family protein [Marimonas arenosa]|uniref:Pyridoxamine 5'-phosphate oxidase family protein n=1 Tax=Marimonas arenosa TaxID=1795305 RepID=A0AAE3WGW3_9RHOB|nr:pyridoxamine 5'-phosphate oxidase family protein [Marimonas arenosa]MDQ2091480.1 pyridoxamine 5'-phosphate oxidase family protein [Marimonas arenosa]
MATQFPAFEPQHIAFIEEQHIFFVGTAAPDGRVNLSPKGSDSLRVPGPNRILWRNLTGSGNETAGHLMQANRMTLMWCAFTTRPLILRAYGAARTIHSDDPEWVELNSHFPPHIGARQVYDMAIDLVQTSCGYAVPLMDFRADRDTLDIWSEDRGADGIRTYWDKKNGQTIDGAPTR